jgi:NAD(P)-dependent dehydrogenase (short-subunit alcohol dehydrogenase family)
VSRVAVVTGGASGIGAAICQHLAAADCAVGVLDVNLDQAEGVVQRLRVDGARAMAACVDVADRSTVDAAFAGVRSELGAIEILVTSAAIAAFTPFEEISIDEWTRMLAVNLTGTFHCVQAAIPDMTAAGWGRIVTISSSAGQVGSPLQAHYSATKGGVIAFTKALAREYASRGITVNTVPPFSVDTPMFRAAQDARQLPSSDVVARLVPAGRLGTGDDIAAACAFLCSDAAGYITGQLIAPNGGAVL